MIFINFEDIPSNNSIPFKFSIIMSVYNSENYLDKSIDSILNQTIGFVNNVQLIIVNDGSTDSSQNIIDYYKKLYPDNIVTIKQENQGQSNARNQGLKYIKGEYINFLDSDDYLSENCLEEVYNTFNSTNVDLVSIKKIYFEQENRENIVNKKYLNKVFNLKEEYPYPVTSVTNTFFNSAKIEKNNITFNENLNFSEDFLFVNTYLLYNSNVCFINQAKYYYRKHMDFLGISDSIIFDKKYYSKRFDECHLKLLDKCLNEFKNVPTFIQENILYDLKEFILNANLNYLLNNFPQIYNNIKKILEHIDEKNLIKTEYINEDFINLFKNIKFNEYNSIDNTHLKKIINNNQKYNENIKVSIIIPVYNVEKYLDECLKSVINQTLKEIEIICIDDGSTDNSLKIIEKYAKEDSRIKIISKKNEGQAIARNLGIDHAIGKYIGFVDSDDFIDKDMFKKLYEKAIQKDLDIVMCAVKTYDDITKKENTNDWYYSLKCFDNFKKPVFNHWHTLEFTNEISVTPINKLYNKNFLLNKNIKFPENIIFEDEVFFYNIYLNAIRMSVIEEPLYTYRINRYGSTVTSNSDNNYKDIVKVFKHIRDIFIKKDRLKIYKKQLYNKMINGCLTRYSQTAPKYKSEFWELLKEDFSSIISFNKTDEDEYKLNINELDIKIRNRTKKLLLSNTYETFKEKDSFKEFTVVMPIYNTEKYLDDAIQSIITQSIGFVHNVQLILVNDGSTDSSQEIIDKYQQLYPDNILSLKQENQGQSSARNYGLNHVKGKYVNFLDSDDYLSYNCFKDVYNFFEKHSDETDVVALPLYQFGRTNSPHILNYKFKKERVIDLLKEPNNPQLTISSTFIKSEMFENIRFKTGFMGSEDANVINKILLNKKTLGVINSSKYFYRRRENEKSTLDTMGNNFLHYTPRLKYHFLDLIKYCLDYELHIPYFIQYMMAYDIQWILNISDINVFKDDMEHEEFLYYLNIILNYIENEVILNNFNIKNKDLKKFFYTLKNGQKIIIENNNVKLKTNKIVLDQLKTHQIWLDIIEIKESKLLISGLFNSYFNREHLSISAIKNNQERYISKPIFYTLRKDKKFLSKIWKYNSSFEIEIPLDSAEINSVNLELNYHKNKNKKDFSKDNLKTVNVGINFNKFCNISKYNKYSIYQDTILTYENNSFKIYPYSYKKLVKLEKDTLKQFKNNDNPVFKHTYKLRLIYLLLFPIIKYFKYLKNIWIFMDRINLAGDNSEALFNYAINQKDNIMKFYVISENSEDYSKLKHKKHIIKYNSLKHKLLYLFADKIIVSHPDEEVHNPFYPYYSYYCGLTTAKKYFIQHGVTVNNVSTWLKRYEKNLSLISTVSKYEHDSFINSGYGYNENIIKILGFPRHDLLKTNKKDIKKQILLVPTWRNNDDNKEELLSSTYFKNLKKLLNNKKLFEILHNNGYKLVFKPHPNLQKYIHLLEIPKEVINGTSIPYDKLFRESSLLITDYSSVSFDFAYLKKPIIYYQYYEQFNFDTKKSYFNYENMGFGEIIKTEDLLIETIRKYLENNCLMKSKYKERVEKFYKFSDNNNCQRNYAWIKNN
ncbi:glycosyltransferase [Methanosphaera sp. ISO3-F5]|uniref:bifunctional glycosyltransferase/CDP-glycerol:glycerophosphate glycerophosphotransferase n=1 Tax=Methanosphaera sp. ISO3-F5 TaxID=1452353 RepID=UPI002B2589F7|nr:glycosyltransferase [Methanosphaera sp. ISO3-F5]WQH63448.1 glycosyltransferase [Methanosphaera sp. ISO3-F5]